MKSRDKFKITKEKRDEMIASIKAYYLDEREEEIGDLAASMMLDFVMEELAPEFYNQGVYDAYKYINDRVEDLLGIQK